MGKITDEDAAKFEKINVEQREFIQGLNKSTTEMGKLNAEVDQLAATVAGGAIAKATDDLKKGTDEATKATKQYSSLKAELRALKAEIANGDMGAKELRAATLRAAELEDTIGDINERVKGLASDTKRLDAVVTAFRGIAAGISVATGAAALFGSENKELEKTLMKVQGAMALLQGVQELATIATGNSALKTMVLDGAQKAVAVSARVMGSSIAAATATATAGLTLVVAGVAYLVTELNNSEDDIEAFKNKLNSIGDTKEAIETRIQLIKAGLSEEVNTVLDIERKKRQLLIQFQTKRNNDLKAADDAFNELDSAEKIRFYGAYLRKREAIILSYQNSEKLVIANYEKEMLAAKQKFNKKEVKQNEEKEKKIADNHKKHIEKIKQQLNYEAELRTDVYSRVIDTYSSFNAAQLKASEEFNMSQSELMDEFYESEIEDFEEFLKKKRDLRDADAAEQKSLMTAIKNASIDAAIQITNALFDINNNRRNEELNNELNFLNAQKDSELNNLELTEAQKLKINMRYALQERRIKQEAARAQYNADLAQASINVALAVSKALATIPPPANIPAAAAAGISAGAQVAIIAAQGPPKFAKGVERLIGEGTGTSDDIWAKLSMGERVVPTDVNNDYFTALSAMHNRKVDPTLANNIMSALSNGNYQIAAEFVAKSSEKTNFLDYERLGQVMERGRSNVDISLDEKGFIKYITTKNGRTEYKNKKLRFQA